MKYTLSGLWSSRAFLKVIVEKDFSVESKLLRFLGLGLTASIFRKEAQIFQTVW